MRPYQRPGLVLQQGAAADGDVVKALQTDLRALGYLRKGIDGSFGPGCVAAVRALQFDLLHNDGRGTGADGAAPIAVTSFNVGGAVTAIDGILNQPLADCIAAMLDSPAFAALPQSADPVGHNASALAAIAAARAGPAPNPFIAAIVLQESGGCHYNAPGRGDADTFIVVGTDRNGAADQITSRGYGIGQYTLFHHPPSATEVADFMVDPLRNVARAQTLLRGKFDHDVAGKGGADDHAAEHPLLPLRLCRYASSDPRYMNDCVRCARAVPALAIAAGTPFYKGAADSYQPTQYYASASYAGVPDRSAFLCDWPYAVRRYNGGGVNSYHYQTRVLLNLATRLAPMEMS